MSADRWDGRTRLLPAGPWREPLVAVRRATLAIVTRKAAPHADAVAVLEILRRRAPTTPGAVAHLAPRELRPVAGVAADGSTPAKLHVNALSGARVLAISAVGDPESFRRQLEALGARVTPAVYRDHHPFTAADAQSLAGGGAGFDLVVCTLKDAVKLGPLWPRQGRPLWYVSQRLTVERGREEVDALLRTALDARTRPPRLP